MRPEHEVDKENKQVLQELALSTQRCQRLKHQAFSIAGSCAEDRVIFLEDLLYTMELLVIGGIRQPAGPRTGL